MLRAHPAKSPFVGSYRSILRTARSTVGTATELYDYLRLLFGRIGRVHCPRCGSEARSDAADTVTEALVREHPDARALVCFPLPVPVGGDTQATYAALLRRGFARVKVGGEVRELADAAGQPAALPAPEPGQPERQTSPSAWGAS